MSRHVEDVRDVDRRKLEVALDARGLVYGECRMRLEAEDLDIAAEAQARLRHRAVRQGDHGVASDLKIGNAGLELIFSDGITFELFGDLALHFDAETIDVTPRISISAEEVEFAVDVEFEDGWKAPLGIAGLTLDEVGFEIGVNFLPAPGVNLGLEGQSHIGNQDSGSDDFAFVLEIVEAVPNPLLLSFYLAELDVKTAMAVFAPDVDGSSLPGFVNDVKVTELSFYWADSVVTLPDGTVAQPGLRFSGNVEILSFKAHPAKKNVNNMYLFIRQCFYFGESNLPNIAFCIQ